MVLLFYLTHHAVCPQQQSGDVRRISHKVCGGFKEASDQQISLMAFSNALKSTFKVDDLIDCFAVQKQEWKTLKFMQFFSRMLSSQSCHTFHRNTSDT